MAMMATSLFLFGQSDNIDPGAEVGKLSFLEGQWKGSGWMIGPDRKKVSFIQTEDVSFAVSGRVLLVKGLGKTRDPETGEEMVIHDALAMITFNPKDDHYDFRSYVAGRGAGNHYGLWVKENHFEWFLETPNGKIRYTITLNDQGQWYEIGEFDTGGSWVKFFEMTLDKRTAENN